MSAELFRFSEERVSRARKNWTPLDALKNVIADIESGEIVIEELACHYIRKDGASRKTGFVLAGVSRAEHVALLNIALAEAIEDWRK